MSLKGTILDATALIDFHWLDEWAWLEENYSPLYIAQEVLDSDRLELPTLADPSNSQESFYSPHP